MVEGNESYKLFVCQGCGVEMKTSVYTAEKLWCNRCKRKRDNEATYRARAKYGRMDRKDALARNEREKCKWPYRTCNNRIAEGNRYFCSTHHENAEFNSDNELTKDGSIFTSAAQKDLTERCNTVIEAAKKIVLARPTTKVYNAETLGRVLFGKIVGELYPECGC